MKWLRFLLNALAAAAFGALWLVGTVLAYGFVLLGGGSPLWA